MPEIDFDLEPDRLFALWEHNIPRGRDRNVVSVTNFEAWRERARAFEDMAALVPAPMTLPSPDGPERVMGAEVSPGYFRLLGVRPALGRDFSGDEGAAASVVILSEAYWRTRKDGAPGVDGQTWAEYGQELEANLCSLLERLKTQRYRAPAVRRKHIPKAGRSRWNILRDITVLFPRSIGYSSFFSAR